MRQKVFRVTIPLTFDEHLINQLTGKTFKEEKDFVDYCQDTAKEMIQKACESDAIFYMMEIESMKSDRDIN
jgi:hypothetical protein